MGIQVTEVDPGEAKGIPENQRTQTDGQCKSISEPSLSGFYGFCAHGLLTEYINYRLYSVYL